RAGRVRRDHDLQAEGPATDRSCVGGGARRRPRGGCPLVGRSDAPRRQASRAARALTRVRHPGRGSERLAPSRGAAAGRSDVLDRRPRVHERDRGERPPRQTREARAGRHVHGRVDRAHVHHGARMIVASTTYESVLLILKIAFLVLLYLFIWRIVRTAARDLRLPQESFILRPALAGGPIGQSIRPGRLVVVVSPVLELGEEYELNSSPLTVGRAGQNDVALENDEFASARHVRIEPRRDGVWVNDLGSTNGTFVNGIRIDRPRKLVQGDVIRVGETELRFEE